jgi:hypothetical protein
MSTTTSHKKKGRSLPITEQVIRYVITKTRNNKEASDYLNVHTLTWRKYASQVYDQETGLSVYRLHTAAYQKKTNWKKYWLENIAPNFRKEWEFKPVSLVDVFSNKVTYKNPNTLLKRMVKEKVRPLACEVCGYDSRPVYVGEKDMSATAFWTNFNLKKLDLNEENNSLENLLIVCKCCEHNIFKNKEEYNKVIKDQSGKLKPSSEIIKSILALVGMSFDPNAIALTPALQSVLEGPSQKEVEAAQSKKNTPITEELENSLGLDWDD